MDPIGEGDVGRQLVDVDAFEGLASALGEDFNELIEAYLEDTPRKLDSLRRALAAGHREQVAEWAHSLKGSSSNLGLMGMADPAGEMEVGVRKGVSITDLRSLMRFIDAVYPQLVDFLRRRLDGR